MRKDRIVWVDLARTLAITLIVGFHLLYEINPDQVFRPIGFVGASLFFIISGFMLAKAYPNLTAFNFDWIKKRYLKIASLYYPALVTIILLFGTQTYFKGFYDLALHFLFLNSISHDTAYSIISPAWFLVPMMALYVLYPFLNRLLKKQGFFLAIVVILAAINRLMELSLVSFSPVFFLSEFCFGITVAHGRKDVWLLAPLLLGIVQPVMVLPYIIFYVLVKFEPIFLQRLFSTIGNRTFEIFLFHESFMMVVLGKWSIYGLDTITSTFFLLLSFVLVIMLSEKLQKKL